MLIDGNPGKIHLQHLVYPYILQINVNVSLRGNFPRGRNGHNQAANQQLSQKVFQKEGIRGKALTSRGWPCKDPQSTLAAAAAGPPKPFNSSLGVSFICFAKKMSFLMRDSYINRERTRSTPRRTCPSHTYARGFQLGLAPYNVLGAFVCAGLGWVTDGQAVLLNLFPSPRQAICPRPDSEREGSQLSPRHWAAVGQRKLISITVTLYSYCSPLRTPNQRPPDRQTAGTIGQTLPTPTPSPLAHPSSPQHLPCLTPSPPQCCSSRRPQGRV